MKNKLKLLCVAAACICLCGCSNSTAPSESSQVYAAAETPAPTPEPDICINGSRFSPELQEIFILDYPGSVRVLAESLRGFRQLERVDLRSSGISCGDCMELAGLLPDTEFIWNVPLFGCEYPCDITELDISGTAIENTAELEAQLEYLPRLRKVIMCECGLSDEEMDELNRRWEDILFVWTVHFSVYSLRTDAEYFCASDVPWLGYVAPELYSWELQPLRYCTELIALDLGHMNYTDIEFLSGMTKLKYLILVQGKFSDISPIANMPELEYLELFNNNRIIDITPLLKCTRLKHLNLGYCYFLDCAPLMEMKQLERLWLPHVGLSDSDKQALVEALPDTLIHCPFEDPMGSTGAGWRDDPSYFEMRDIFGMNYLPGGTGVH